VWIDYKPDRVGSKDEGEEEGGIQESLIQAEYRKGRN